MSSIPIKFPFKKRKKEIISKFQEEEILEISLFSNFYGIASKKYKQIRGNGVLILTKDEIFFGMFIPKREIKISLKSIIEIKTPKWFLGKTRFRPTLAIVFINEEGKTDSAAWEVRNIDRWVSRIDQIRTSKK
ncbi:MAG: hypothetical protein H7645_05170 [Candidatus Heimdallarchaeota archaeon]|nr:hypothetical protein [Candidatus Heimdallarchaeota archaeon]MCK4769712.1 hypothetical protein [Candidatus Heimdallarchaeota archaeon]